MEFNRNWCKNELEIENVELRYHKTTEHDKPEEKV